MNIWTKHFLALGLVFFATSVLAKAPSKSAKCDFENTILRPAVNNSCFQALVSKASDPDDRTWMLNLQKTWNPDPKLKIILVPGGLIAYKGEKRVLDARWVFSKPLTLSWNDKIIVYKGDVKTNSVRKMLNEILDSKQKTALFSLLIPEAKAQAATDENFAKDLFTLYLFQKNGDSQLMDAKAMIQKFYHTPGIFPELGLKNYVSTKTFQCSKGGGLESFTHDFEKAGWIGKQIDGKKPLPVVMKPHSSGRFQINGLTSDKPILAEIKPVSGLSTDALRVYDASALVDNKNSLKIQYSTCEDEACEKKTQIQDGAELTKLVKKEFQESVRRDLDRSLMGLSILSSCCQSDSCRTVAREKVWINLEPTKDNNGGQK